MLTDGKYLESPTQEFEHSQIVQVHWRSQTTMQRNYIELVTLFFMLCIVILEDTGGLDLYQPTVLLDSHSFLNANTKL